MSDLRTTMGDDRLDSLMLLFSSKDILEKLHIGEIVRAWLGMKNRRIIV